VDFLYGRSSLSLPLRGLAERFRFLTSKPMWSSTRPLVVTVGMSVLEKLKFAPGMSAAWFCPRIPGFAPNVLAYQAWI
jgi:hypothetical protein